MDKNSIKKYAVWARRELIARVSQRALYYGITEKDTCDAKADSVNGRLLSPAEKKQRQALIAQIRSKGYQQVMEEVAYTWFNRFSALRFMEVNGYLPTHVRVFTDEENSFKPQIITEAIHLELDGLDMEKVYAFKEKNQTEELYKYLLITQCNALSLILSGMFQRIEDYTELLFPDNLLREGSVIEQMIALIPQEDFDITSGGQVEIIGWLYQYYNDERKNEVINISNKSAVNKEDIPAATQLFTTDWVVRYIIDNSLGRYWIERNPDSSLKVELEYYITPKDETGKTVNGKVKPEELSVFDPCMGSAHFLIYAFEVLMKIYAEYGYSERDAAKAIVENNLYGLDIDDRASQLAYFAVIMKARQYDRRFLTRGVQPHVHSICESNHLDPFCVEYFVNGDAKLKVDMQTLIDEMNDAKEFGSIINLSQVDFDAISARFDEVQDDINIYREAALKDLMPLVQVAKIMSQKYDVVATNPPYLNKMDTKLKKYVADNYKDYSGDLFSVFMYRNFGYCKKDGYSGFMTPFVWMFIKTYEKLREYILNSKSIITLIQMEYSAFEEATVPICSFILKNGEQKEKGVYFKLSDFTGGMEIQKQKVIEALKSSKCSYLHFVNQNDFEKIPSSPIAYWANSTIFNIFESIEPLSKYATTRLGMTTANNEIFVRFWEEVNIEKIGFNMNERESAFQSKAKWFPYNKGGDFRRWYGNNELVVNWEKDGYEIQNFKDERTGRIRSHNYNLDYVFKEGLTWSALSSTYFSVRRVYKGFLFDDKGSSAFTDNMLIEYILGFLNSKIAGGLIKLLNPTISFQPGNLSTLPLKIDVGRLEHINQLVASAISISKADWDSFETSWDFVRHPLMHSCSIVAEAYAVWETECSDRFNRLKSSEEELNRIFIDIYGLQDELTPEVEDKDVTVRKADLQRDIKSLFSYAVGCMFGRYSLNVDGIAYAGGEWDSSKYASFPADKDNIIPICDDEYFEDDIVGRFVKFIEVVYGKETLEENLRFIADALGGSEMPRDVIRNYFINDFYNNHLKIYQKRPIYWLFDSGKKNGFKVLIYMHRYQPDTIARMRTDYVHEQQARYRTAIMGLEQRINGASTGERVKLNKQLAKLKDQAEELRIYEEKTHHLADQMIRIDLDDGVKHNYALFEDVLAIIK